MLVKVFPSRLDCHCTVEAGLLVAVEINDAVLFKHIVASFGCVETTGGVLIVIVALPDAVPVQRESETELTV